MLSNLATRDVETLLHPYTNLSTHRQTGPLVLERGGLDPTSRRRIEPLPVLAIEEGVNGKFGARSRKETWGRWWIIGW